MLSEVLWFGSGLGAGRGWKQLADGENNPLRSLFIVEPSWWRLSKGAGMLGLFLS